MAHMSYLEDQLKEMLAASVELRKALENNQPMCPNCFQLRQQLAEKDQIIRELRSANDRVNHRHDESMRSTYISENQQANIDNAFLEAYHRENNWKSKYEEALDTERMLQAQLEAYKSDFEMERLDRAEARGQLENVRVQLEASERERNACIIQLREASKIIENQKRVIQTMHDERLAINLQFNGQRQHAFPRTPVFVGRGFDEPDSEIAEDSSVADAGDRAGDRTSPLPGRRLSADEPFSVRFNALGGIDCGLSHGTNYQRTTSPARECDVSLGLNLTESSPLSHSALHNSSASRHSKPASTKVLGTRDTWS